MVDARLKSYVDRCLDQGYSRNQIANYLLNQGYSKEEVYKVIPPPEKKMNTYLIIFGIIAISIAILLVLNIDNIIEDEDELVLKYRKYCSFLCNSYLDPSVFEGSKDAPQELIVSAYCNIFYKIFQSEEGYENVYCWNDPINFNCPHISCD